MSIKQTEKIKLWGIVQGVGFRPFVAKVAKNLNMNGQVLNIGGLVEITVTDTRERIDAFLETIESQKPGPSEIVHIKREPLPLQDFDHFEIIRSDEGDDEAAMIPADLAICPHCLGELYDPQNPRYQHPFISCMICGPRYTMIHKIPYDRENTSMEDFPMCDFCHEEYTSINDRRYHAQTISCHQCGPQLIWSQVAGGQEKAYETDAEILDHAAEILKNGGVIAFKSVGGYNLAADPFHPNAVRKLRETKHRESKPFAVMFRSVEEIRKYCSVSLTEEKLLTSSARPIILLEHGLDQMEPEEGKDFSDLLSSRFIGSFLPSFAAQYMLLDRISPLIFTSANTSDMPMITGDLEMQSSLRQFNRGSILVDGILYNKRRILTRVDDSVVRVIDDQPQMIRRSKGYAPVPLYVEAGSASWRQNQENCPSILAVGSQLKNSFALSKGPFVYVSQYFGDMDTIENQNIYQQNLTSMSSLFRIEPKAIVCDMHPLYYTTAFAEKYAKDHHLPLLKVQHHHAHIASVMAENGLEGPVIGISFDGTGYGRDGAIWGGEIMLCEGGDMHRLSHLKYVRMIGGDSSMKDAVRSALSYIASYENDWAPEPDEFSPDLGEIIHYGRKRLMEKPEAPLVQKALDAGINTIRSSSMGRLFDAVSSLLGICDYNQHEGKCAILLEDAAAWAQNHPGEASPTLGSAKACQLALSFHQQIIQLIIDQCEIHRDKSNKIVLTGGTFQNRILMEGILQNLRDRGFEPYYNISVSPNDGGIALGQTFIAMHKYNDDLGGFIERKEQG